MVLGSLVVGKREKGRAGGGRGQEEGNKATRGEKVITTTTVMQGERTERKDDLDWRCIGRRRTSVGEREERGKKGKLGLGF